MMKKIVLMVFMSIGVNAAELTIPNTFVANTPAVASEVNGNFAAVETAVDDNNARIAALEATIASLQATVNSLNSRLTSVENNTVLELDGLLQFSMFKGYPTAEFTGVNVQVNNGTGITIAANGLGNLTVGYNEASNTASEFCSDPQYTDSVNCIGNLELWGRNVYRGSHYLILGTGHSYDDSGGMVSGRNNISNGLFASVVGGNNNIASGAASAILGGDFNIASGESSTVSGGRQNQTTSSSSSISGGWGNIASAITSSITGGRDNRATALYSTVTGGFNNQSDGNSSSVSGGSNRTAAGLNDWVAGSLFENF